MLVAACSVSPPTHLSKWLLPGCSLRLTLEVSIFNGGIFYRFRRGFIFSRGYIFFSNRGWLLYWLCWYPAVCNDVLHVVPHVKFPIRGYWFQKNRLILEERLRLTLTHYLNIYYITPTQILSFWFVVHTSHGIYYFVFSLHHRFKMSPIKHSTGIRKNGSHILHSSESSDQHYPQSQNWYRPRGKGCDPIPPKIQQNSCRNLINYENFLLEWGWEVYANSLQMQN